MTDYSHRHRTHGEESRRREHEGERERRRPDRNARPRANPPVDRYDLDRGRAKLERVIGK